MITRTAADAISQFWRPCGIATAEISKQFKGSVVAALDKAEADGILAAVSEEEKGTGAKVTGRYLGLHDVATGTVSPLDKEAKPIIWLMKPATGVSCSASSNAVESVRLPTVSSSKLKKAMEEAK